VDELLDNEDLVNSQFLLLLEDLTASSFSQQHIFFTESHLHASLAYLASLHSMFWGKTEADPRFDFSLLWKSATYWTLDKRPDDELQVLPGVWSLFCEKMSGVSEIFKQSNIRNLGDRLVQKVEWTNAARKGFAVPQTLVHGDFKSANIFFRSDPGTHSLKVSVIDWQWSGTGAGICDVMYVALGAYELGLWQDNFKSEREVVKYYCDQLSAHGIEYPLRTAIRDFRIAALDYARIVLAYFYKDQTPQSLEAALKDPGELTHTSSVPHVAEFALYLDRLLAQLETTGDFII